LLVLTSRAAIGVPAAAQSVDDVVTPPPNLVLANCDNVPVGPFGGLEGSAHAARVGDPSAAWFNPAGLSRQTSTQISGGAGVYQVTSISPQAVPTAAAPCNSCPVLSGSRRTSEAG